MRLKQFDTGKEKTCTTIMQIANRVVALMPAKTIAKRQLSSRFVFDADYPIHGAHFVFRYPAKFHVPIAAQLVQNYSSPSETILDPFCGSGTILLEAKLHGRASIGVDIDPLAVFVSQTKSHSWRSSSLAIAWTEFEQVLTTIRRSKKEYERLQHCDISERSLRSTLRKEDLWVPEIPNLGHWFRRYVQIDLARLLFSISQIRSAVSRKFFRLCFGSIIRHASNADPVPVSGLEVTSHMRKLDASGRVINPFELFEKAVKKCLDAFSSRQIPHSSVNVRQGDATNLQASKLGKVDVLITSPPYQGAVDYYRRHTLETMWLGLVDSAEERRNLRPKYIGQLKVRKSHPFLSTHHTELKSTTAWEDRIRSINPARANAFRHYSIAMATFFKSAATVLNQGSLAVIVVGKSSWNGFQIPTNELLAELAHESFRLKEQAWYPIKNRYMSFARHNGASIDREHVLVFERKVA